MMLYMGPTLHAVNKTMKETFLITLTSFTSSLNLHHVVGLYQLKWCTLLVIVVVVPFVVIVSYCLPLLGLGSLRAKNVGYLVIYVIFFCSVVAYSTTTAGIIFAHQLLVVDQLLQRLPEYAAIASTYEQRMWLHDFNEVFQHSYCNTVHFVVVSEPWITTKLLSHKPVAFNGTTLQLSSVLFSESFLHMLVQQMITNPRSAATVVLRDLAELTSAVERLIFEGNTPVGADGRWNWGGVRTITHENRELLYKLYLKYFTSAEKFAFGSDLIIDETANWLRFYNSQYRPSLVSIVGLKSDITDAGFEVGISYYYGQTMGPLYPAVRH